jgi:hypothetical protein
MLVAENDGALHSARSIASGEFRFAFVVAWMESGDGADGANKQNNADKAAKHIRSHFDLCSLP